MTDLTGSTARTQRSGWPILVVLQLFAAWCGWWTLVFVGVSRSYAFDPTGEWPVLARLTTSYPYVLRGVLVATTIVMVAVYWSGRSNLWIGLLGLEVALVCAVVYVAAAVAATA